MPDVESRRQATQQRLDAARSAAERNRLGQYATPPALALDITRYARRLWQRRRERVAFLDPAVGTGSFYSALQRVFPSELVTDACGVEIDPTVAEAATQLWESSGLRVVPGDFTQVEPDRRYNLILTNPPYVRHHHLSVAYKDRLRTAIGERLGITVSGLAGLYGHFLLFCDAWMAPGALALWLIPSEFMDVNYGAAVKRYLTENVALRHIHRFSPSDAQFADALVTSAVVVLEKSSPRDDDEVVLSFGGSLTRPASVERVGLGVLRQARKWSGSVGRMVRERRPSPVFGDYFTIQRGLATGANAFFILERTEALRKGIAPEFLRPILPGSRHLTDGVIEAAADGYPRIAAPLALIDCDLPPEAIRQRSPGLWRYLAQGEAQGIAGGYLASRRTPWYAQETRAPAPFLCTYMGRPGRRGNPFRFFWNRSQAVAANVYLMLHPRGVLKTALETRPDLYAALYAYLQSLTPEPLIREGRVYGGGLHKLEPRELANLPADAIERLVAGRAGAPRDASER